jgi:hypothetical protein
LVGGGLARAVPLTERRRGLPSDRLYAVGLGVNPETLDPIELLQAHVPGGVVCYFTALIVHGLTTQFASHHHIARLKRGGVAASNAGAGGDERRRAENAEVRPFTEGAGPDVGGQGGRDAGPVPPIGTREFVRQGLAYYTTHRDANRIVGIQRRYLNPYTRFRVTTLEQTLLDTLHRPHSCGGAPVVYEAWATGAERLNPQRLATLLDRIGDARLTRRTGYMLDQYPISAPSPELSHVLARARQQSAPTGHWSEEAVVPLLPGVPPTEVNTRWGVAVP